VSGDGAQATVEAALVLPFVALLALVIVQVGLLVQDQILVTHAAREAARAAAVDSDPNAPTAAAAEATKLDANRLTVSVDGRAGRGSRVHVTVHYHAPTDVPLVGSLLGDVDLTADATMRVE
jgi:Flp pilus assembly protein TadG